jgi:hypothetical protein
MLHENCSCSREIIGICSQIKMVILFYRPCFLSEALPIKDKRTEITYKICTGMVIDKRPANYLGMYLVGKSQAERTSGTVTFLTQLARARDNSPHLTGL